MSPGPSRISPRRRLEKSSCLSSLLSSIRDPVYYITKHLKARQKYSFTYRISNFPCGVNNGLCTGSPITRHKLRLSIIFLGSANGAWLWNKEIFAALISESLLPLATLKINYLNSLGDLGLPVAVTYYVKDATGNFTIYLPNRVSTYFPQGKLFDHVLLIFFVLQYK